MALRRHKPLPAMRPAPEPIVELTLSEAKALRGALMGDAFSVLDANAAVTKINAVADRSSPTGGAADGTR